MQAYKQQKVGGSNPKLGNFLRIFCSFMYQLTPSPTLIVFPIKLKKWHLKMVFVATKQVTEKIYGLDSTIYITLFTNDFLQKSYGNGYCDDWQRDIKD